MKFTFLLAVVLIISSCYSTQSISGYGHGANSFNNDSMSGMPQGPGCYSKCMMPYEFQAIEVPILQYTGDDFEDPNVEYTSIEISEPTERWVKKKADNGCRSSNPEDCMVWCLVKTLAKYFDYYTVIDTNVNKQFVIQKIDQISLKEGGWKEWRKVVCENDVTPLLLYNIQNELLDRDYITEENYVDDPGYTSTLKTALAQFQKDNHLPVGQLDFETLSALGVDY